MDPWFCGPSGGCTYQTECRGETQQILQKLALFPISFRYILKSGIPKSYSWSFTPKTYSVNPKERVPKPKVLLILNPKEWDP